MPEANQRALVRLRNLWDSGAVGKPRGEGEPTAGRPVRGARERSLSPQSASLTRGRRGRGCTRQARLQTGLITMAQALGETDEKAATRLSRGHAVA